MIGQPRTKVEVPELPGGTENRDGWNGARPADTRTAEQKAAEQKALVEQASKVTNAIDPESKPPDKVLAGTEKKGSNVRRNDETRPGVGQPR